MCWMKGLLRQLLKSPIFSNKLKLLPLALRDTLGNTWQVFSNPPPPPLSLSGLWSDHNGAIKVMKSGENVTIVIKRGYVCRYLCYPCHHLLTFSIVIITVPTLLATKKIYSFATHSGATLAWALPCGPIPPSHQIRPKFLKAAEITKLRVSGKVCRENLKRLKCIRSRRWLDRFLPNFPRPSQPLNDRRWFVEMLLKIWKFNPASSQNDDGSVKILDWLICHRSSESVDTSGRDRPGLEWYRTGWRGCRAGMGGVLGGVCGGCLPLNGRFQDRSRSFCWPIRNDKADREGDEAPASHLFLFAEIFNPRALEENLFATNSHLLRLLSFCWLAINLTWRRKRGPKSWRPITECAFTHICIDSLFSSHARVCFCKFTFSTALTALAVCQVEQFLRLSPFLFCSTVIWPFMCVYPNIWMDNCFRFSDVYDFCIGADLFRFLFCRCLIVGPHTYWQGELMKNPCKTSKHWDVKHLHWTNTNLK